MTVRGRETQGRERGVASGPNAMHLLDVVMRKHLMILAGPVSEEVGAEEGCVHSTNNGIRVRLEERDLFHYRRRREERHVHRGRYVCGVWGLSLDSAKRDSSAGSEDGAGGLAVSWAGVKA